MHKLVAIATADWHIHKFKNFDVNNSRINWTLDAAREIMKTAERLEVPILFAGDLIHSPKDIENETNAMVQKLFKNYRNWFVAISGNHDMSQRNGKEFKSPSHLDSILNPKFVKLDGQFAPFNGRAKVWGIPYMDNDKDLFDHVNLLRPQTKKWDGLKILLLHSDIPGAVTTTGYSIDSMEHMPKHLDKFFKEWDLVLCGHIHKPQKISDKVYMLGCPIQQDEGDRNNVLGYWEVYDDAAMEFKELINYPKFIRLKKGKKPGNSVNYYIKYNEILEEQDVKLGEFNITNSKVKLAKLYLAQNQINSKSKKRALIKILHDEK